MLYSQNLLKIFIRMLKVAAFFQCTPFERVKNTGEQAIIKIASGWKLTAFKVGLIWVSIQVFLMIFQIYQSWCLISMVEKLESVFFICVISFGAMLQLALFQERNLFVKMIREMAKFETRYNRKSVYLTNIYIKT